MRPDLASRLARDWLAAEEQPLWRHVDGSMVLVDISGFTRLTEVLQGRGPEGVELLHRALTLCFSAVLGPSLAVGGDVIGFAGDAAMVWFSGEDHPTRAVRAAASIPASLADLPATVTGGRRLRVSVGAHSGTVLAVMAGTEQRELFLCGPEMSTLVRLEAAAESGQVLISPELAALVPASLVRSGAGPPEAKRHRPDVVETFALPPITTPDPVDADVAERWWSLLSPAVRPLVEGDDLGGDHRWTTAGFVELREVDERLLAGGPEAVAEMLVEFIGTVERVCRELSVTWLDSDVSDGGIKLLLAAGTPLAVPDDEGRMLLALRQILDALDLPVRAGSQRGRVFAGCLGVAARRTYCTLGDPVNVAARALGLASDHELIAADGLKVSSRPDTEVESIGPVSLKNRAVPVEMFRVLTVDPSAPLLTAPGADVVATAHQDLPARLTIRWDEACAGRGSSVLLHGGPGMGAPELIGLMTQKAGAAVTSVRADALGRQVPYGTVTEIVGSMAEASGSTLTGWEWLSSFADELDGPTRPWLDDGRAAFQASGTAGVDPVSLGERATTVLTELIVAAAPAPTLLAVEGIENVDPASEAVLTALRSKADSQPWLILVTTEADIPSDGYTDSVFLEPLDRDSARELVEAAGPGLRQEQIGRIIDAARGNPFLLSELAKNPQPGELPDSVERLSAMQIDGLPVAARHLVREASAFGLEVEQREMADVLGRQDLTVRSTWKDAAAVLSEARPGVMSFRYPAYRDAAYASLTFSERRTLHGAIADHLVSKPDTSPGVLAAQYGEAGRHREAFPLALEAARSARSVGAIAQSGDFLEQAARLAQEVDSGQLGRILSELGDTRGLEGDFERADEAFAKAARVLHDPIAYAAMCSDRAGLSLRRGRYRQARRFTRTGLVLTAPFVETAVSIRGRLLLDEAAALHFVGDNNKSLPLALAALQNSKKAEDQLLEGRANLHLEMIYSALGRQDSRDHGEAAIDTFARLGHDRYLTDALTNCGFTAMFAGEWNDAIDLYERAAQAAARTGDSVNGAIIEMNRGYLISRQGNHADAEVLGRSALDVFQRADLELHSAHARYLLGTTAAGQNNMELAEQAIDLARAGFEAAGDVAMVIDCDVVMMALLLEASRVEEALRLGRDVEGRIDQADDAVKVTFLLHMGSAEVLSTNARHGVGRIIEGADLARRRELPYEEYLCLDELLRVEDLVDQQLPQGSSERKSELAARLGLLPSPL